MGESLSDMEIIRKLHKYKGPEERCYGTIPKQQLHHQVVQADKTGGESQLPKAVQLFKPTLDFHYSARVTERFAAYNMLPQSPHTTIESLDSTYWWHINTLALCWASGSEAAGD